MEKITSTILTVIFMALATQLVAAEIKLACVQKNAAWVEVDWTRNLSGNFFATIDLKNKSFKHNSEYGPLSNLKWKDAKLEIIEGQNGIHVQFYKGGHFVDLENYYFDLSSKKYVKQTASFLMEFMAENSIEKVITLDNKIRVEKGSCREIDEKDHLKMMASYLGIAEFCNAYGVDFRNKANKVLQGILETTNFDKSLTRTELNTYLEKGNFGELYSIVKGDYLSVSTSSDPFKTCRDAHLEVIKISKLK